MSAQLAFWEAEEYVEDFFAVFEEWPDFLCLDCGQDTCLLGEYYMVRDEFWLAANPDRAGMLCIGCLERRLGRELTSSDFTDCPLNQESLVLRSSRLTKRLAA